VNGLVNRKEVDRETLSKIHLVAYEVVYPRMPKSEQYKALKNWNLRVVPHERHSGALDPDAMTRTLRAAKVTSAYDIDGLVIEAEGPFQQTEDRTPSYAFAWKENEEGAITRVHAVEWNLSKTGYLKPTVLYDPIELQGTNLRRATGFHARFIEDNHIGPGARIRVVLSGDVIPKITDVLEPSPMGPSMPSTEVWGALEWTDSGIDLRISNGLVSDDQMKQVLLSSFQTLQAKHVSEKGIDKLWGVGVHSPRDLPSLPIEKWMTALGEAMGRKAHASWHAAFAAASPARRMIASGVFPRGIGELKLQKVLDALPNATRVVPRLTDLVEIKGIEETTAELIRRGLDTLSTWEDAWRLTPAPPSRSRGSSRWSQEVLVFTGFRNAALQARLQELGARVRPSVTRDTTMLIVADPDIPDSSKVAAARARGLVIQSRKWLEEQLR
jgi:DNA ligase (NAD+)